MRMHRLASMILLLSTLCDCFASMRSHAVAVTLTARVAPVVRLAAASPTSTASTVALLGAGQNGFTFAFTATGDETAVIQIPVVLQSNVNDVLFKASFDVPAEGSIWIEGSGIASSAFVSKPTPLAPNVAFAMACDMVRRPVVPIGTALPATLWIAIPPGGLPQGQRITAQITIEALQQ